MHVNAGNNDIKIELIPEPGFERFVKAVEPVGTYEKWKES